MDKTDNLDKYETEKVKIGGKVYHIVFIDDRGINRIVDNVVERIRPLTKQWTIDDRGIDRIVDNVVERIRPLTKQWTTEDGNQYPMVKLTHSDIAEIVGRTVSRLTSADDKQLRTLFSEILSNRPIFETDNQGRIKARLDDHDRELLTRALHPLVAVPDQTWGYQCEVVIGVTAGRELRVRDPEGNVIIRHALDAVGIDPDPIPAARYRYEITKQGPHTILSVFDAADARCSWEFHLAPRSDPSGGYTCCLVNSIRGGSVLQVKSPAGDVIANLNVG